ncbi:MAG: hypothetical protein KAJ63_01865, partial [Methyloprofundus sp.]|nr:hypothetical protein [Methyloprofundus sp.]
MRAITHFFCASLILSALTSCSNALYFYEADKISLTVEARPDSSQPVQGNFGLKQRIALVVPPMNSNCKTEPPLTDQDQDCEQEALSAITSFRFKKSPGGLLDIGPVSIKTAFITGKAASDLENSRGAAIAAATAIIGTKPFNSSGVDISIMRNIISVLEKDTENTQAEKLLAQLNALGKIIVPSNYPVTLYRVTLVPASALSNLKIFKDINTIIQLSGGINDALTYWAQLRDSVKLLKDVLNAPTKYNFNGKIPDEPLITSGLNE